MQGLTINHRWWHPVIQKIAATAFGSWLLTENLQRIDKLLLRLTNNRASFTSWLAGLPVILLHSIGAKTGLPRQTPLVALPDGEKIILIASYFGKSRHPSWYYNLKANPEVKVSLNGSSAEYIARLSGGEERESYWQKAVSLYHGYQRYKQQAGDREIPVVVLEPR